ncbi:MAG: PEGA domain-containing protein, partial [Acidobacteriota bacterium]
VGTADDFDGYPDYLYLRRGHYRIEFRLPGYQTRAIDVDARPGTKIDVDDKLAKIPGSAHYGSYDDPLPAGGVRRFWGKRGDTTGAITGDDEIYGSGPRRYRERPRDRDDEYYRENRDGDRDDDDDVDVDRAPADARPAPRDGGWRDRREGGGRMRQGDTWLHLNVHPTDAAIYLDDRFIGTASELGGEPGIAVPPGRHTVVVSRPGYRDKRIPVDVSRGDTEKVEVQLEK